jgi:hypothetical protein
MSDNKLRSLSKYQFWRLGKSPVIGVGDISINAHAIYPLVPLWFDRSWIILLFSFIYVAFFIYVRVRGVSPTTGIRQIRCFLAGKRRYVSKVNRSKRFTNADC